jgi:hypothetical protein
LRRYWLALLDIFSVLLPFSLLFVFMRVDEPVLDTIYRFNGLWLALSLFFSYYGKPFLIQLWPSASTGVLLSSGFHFKKDSIKLKKSSLSILSLSGLLNI